MGGFFMHYYLFTHGFLSRSKFPKNEATRVIFLFFLKLGMISLI
jgi:hypothetical protein